jgi:type I restriction enzyme S subunit
MNKPNNDCKEWSITNLGSIVKFVSGGTPKKDEEKFWNGQIPWVSSGEMTESRIYKTQLNVTEDGALNGTRLAPKNTIFVVVRGMSLAKEFRVSLAMKEMTFNQDVKAIFPTKTIDPIFLFYYLKFQSNPIRDSASEAAHGTKKLDMAVLEQWPISLPLIPTQKKIAAILSAYDDLIENNKRRIALLEKMAEEIYHEWFVRFRFPGYQTAEFEKGIPKGWTMVKLEKAFSYLGGGTPSKDNDAYWAGGNINWYTPSDITGAEGLFLSKSEEQPNEEGIGRSSAKIFPAYSIMMTSRATIGAIGINRTEACTNQGFITCIPNEVYPLVYLYHWLKLSKEYFISLCGGATFPELNKSTFKRIEILTPEKDVITSFNRTVEPIFKQIESLLQANENLKATKNSLLPRLISGKLSVEDLEIQFPPSMQ